MYSINNLTFTPAADADKVQIESPSSKWTVTTEKAREIYRQQQVLLRHPLQDGSKSNDSNECPQHNMPLMSEYRFGMCDAMVYKFKCGCCSVSDGFGGLTYYSSYKAASGRANMVKAKMATW